MIFPLPFPEKLFQAFSIYVICKYTNKSNMVDKRAIHSICSAWVISVQPTAPQVLEARYSEFGEMLVSAISHIHNSYSSPRTSSFDPI